MQKKKTSCRWYVYIVECSDGTFYTGITNNPDRRLQKHNQGVASRYTRSRIPVSLVHSERSATKSGALKKEYALKQLTRLGKEAYIKRKKAAANARRTRLVKDREQK